jgi:hypothetical protein
MTAARRKTLLLLLLAAAAVALLAQRFLDTTAASVFGRSGGEDFTRALESEVADLDLERLERGGAAYAPGRDPWTFVEPPPPAPVAPPPVVRPVRTEPPPPPVPAAPPRPRPPAIDFQYLGWFGPTERPIAVFLDQNGETLYNALEGEVLKGKFQVAQIGLESVQIAFVGFPDEPPAKLPMHGAGK